VAIASNSESSGSSWYSTPAAPLPLIREPAGSAGHTGDSRPGYNLKEELLLTKDQHSKLRVSTFPLVYNVFDASDMSIADH
jgi:hypothetical protein